MASDVLYSRPNEPVQRSDAYMNFIVQCIQALFSLLINREAGVSSVGKLRSVAANTKALAI